MTTALITQSNYVPWRGWFAMAHVADVVVYLDDVQYTRRDWRNRNLIRSSNGIRWITIPVSTSGRYTARICDIEVADDSWQRSHLSILDHTYETFDRYHLIRDRVRDMYQQTVGCTKLSETNHMITRNLFEILGIRVDTYRSHEFPLHEDPTERIIKICLALGVSRYVTGPAAKNYLVEDRFRNHGLQVEWFDYGKLSPIRSEISVGSELSILDLLSVAGLTETQQLIRTSISDSP